ncbi:hypothetical protein D3C73_1386590 [compost metagenome]
MAQLIKLGSTPELAEALALSEDQPLLIFKHSTRCPISAGAYEQMQSYLRGEPEEPVTYALIDVIESRDVSGEVAAKLGIEHQSPQAILVKNGKAVWNTSHSRITETALKEILKGK